MSAFRTVSLLGAAMTSGLSAGVFLLYAHTIMPGLSRTDDRTFVTAFAAIDRAIENPVFMLSAFLGAPALTAAAVVVHRGESPFPLTVLALVLALVVVLVTVVVNLPLNTALKDAVSAGDDPAAVRAAFHAARWQAWNAVRVAASIGAFGCLCWALVLYGRATPTG